MMTLHPASACMAKGGRDHNAFVMDLPFGSNVSAVAATA